MGSKIDTVDSRARAKPRSEPYWVKLSGGCTLGYRKLTDASIGSWYARYRNAETGARAKVSLGDFSLLPAAHRYDAAKKEAEQWFTHLGRGGASVVPTLRSVCENYVKHVRSTAGKGDGTADDLTARFARWVDDAPIGRVLVTKLTRRQVEAWRAELAATPVLIDPHAKEPRTRVRAASSVNRDCAALRAALNYAHDMGDVTTDMAWRVALRPTKGADGRRTVYLDREQRRRLLGSAEADFAPFLTGMTYLPLRPGALAALTAGDFDRKNGVLRIGKDKAGQERRIKLPTFTAATFSKLAKDKLPAAPLFAQFSGRVWTKDAWKKPMRSAAIAAALPPGTVLYTLRHSTITDLVVGGLDLLSVAQLSGTSVEMIEKHYGHLRADHAAEALAKLVL
ncbi:tyrosine-type recombinase/integrase [Roseateles sp.]|uniref:tyrosine-type recombinase/integrase n=1 Tax=Roseateles sp. TaxID=1971397 RepID=UPI0032644227